MLPDQDAFLTVTVREQRFRCHAILVRAAFTRIPGVRLYRPSATDRNCHCKRYPSAEQQRDTVGSLQHRSPCVVVSALIPRETNAQIRGVHSQGWYFFASGHIASPRGQDCNAI